MGDDAKETGSTETDPSETALRESEEDDFGVILADSERAGQEMVSMTDPTSIALFDGTFQAGFFPRVMEEMSAALPLPP